MLAVLQHEAKKLRFLMILGVPCKQGNPGKRGQILQMATRAKEYYSTLPDTRYLETKYVGTRYQESRHLGLLVARYGHCGTPGSQDVH